MVLSCRPESTREPPPPCTDPLCRYQKAIEEGKKALDAFDPERAEIQFSYALTTARGDPSLADPKNLCIASYGLLLSYTQLFFLHVNSLLGGLISAVASGNLGSLIPQQASYSADLLDYLENFYRGNFARSLEGISRTAQEVYSLADCEFQWEAGIPFRLLSNEPFSKVQQNPRVFGIEIRVGKRWDAVEARLLHFFSEFLQGVFGYILAHSLEFDRNQWTQIPILGQDLKFIVECFLGSSTYYRTPIQGTLEVIAGSTDPNGIVDATNECIFKQLGPYLFPVYIFRRLGFIIGDNPKTLARHPRRWDEFMGDVDNHFANALSTLTDLFPALSARSLRHAANPVRADILKEFAFVYDDSQLDGIVNGGDSLSLGIVDVLLKVTPEYDPNLSTLAKTILSTLSISIQDDSVVKTIQKVLETLRDQFRAVDDPGISPELFRIQDLTPVLRIFSVFLPSGANITPPDALALSFKDFFTQPVPLRELAPYWEAITSLSHPDTEVNEFVIEAEFYPTIPTEVANSLGGVTEPLYELFIAPLYNFPFTLYTYPQDVTHFRTRYEALDLSQGVQTPLPRISYNPPLTLPVPTSRDCFAPRVTEIINTLNRLGRALTSPNPNLGAILVYVLFSWAFDFFHYYILFQDPSFHGLIWVKTLALPEPACIPALETNEFQPANLYTLHRTMIGYYHWFRPIVDTIFDLIGQFSG